MVAAVLAGEPERTKVEVTQIGPRRGLAAHPCRASSTLVVRREGRSPAPRRATRHAPSTCSGSGRGSRSAALSHRYVDRDEVVLFANQALRSLLGVTHASELSGRRFESFWQAPDLARAVLAAVTKGESWREVSSPCAAPMESWSRPLWLPAPLSGRRRGRRRRVHGRGPHRTSPDRGSRREQATTRVLLTANPIPSTFSTRRTGAGPEPGRTAG